MLTLARVWGPQPGIRLSHRAEGILHRARADGVPAGSDGAVAEALGEDLEERDRVMGEVIGGNAKVGAELDPQLPGFGGGGDTVGGNTPG